MRHWFGSMFVRALVTGAIAGSMLSCSETSGANNWAPLDYEANPASAKYDFGSVDSTIVDFMADHPGVEGVTLAVVRGGEGQIYEEGYGDFDRDRISMIASTGKVPSAGIIVSLADEGLLDLDRPIAEYLDWGDHHPTVSMRHIDDVRAFASLLGVRRVFPVCM